MCFGTISAVLRITCSGLFMIPTNVEDVDKFVCKPLTDNVIPIQKVHKMAAVTIKKALGQKAEGPGCLQRFAWRPVPSRLVLHQDQKL